MIQARRSGSAWRDSIGQVLFARGIDAIAGTLVLDPAALVQRQRQGKRWAETKAKIVVAARGDGARARY